MVFFVICSSWLAQHDPRPALTQAALRLSPCSNIRVAVLPCSESTTCLFRTRPLDASDTLVFNEVFWVCMSYPALHQKTLRVDVCTTDQTLLEDCLVRALGLSVCLSGLLSFWGLVQLVLHDEGLEKTQIGVSPDHLGSRQTLPQVNSVLRLTGGEKSSFHGRKSNRPDNVFLHYQNLEGTSHMP